MTKKLYVALWAIAVVGSFLYPSEGVSLAFLPALITGLATIGSGIIGSLSNASAQERAAMLQEKGMQEWFDLNIPDPAQRKLALERFVQVGELHPALEQQVKAEESQLGNVTQDQGLRQSRMRALSSLEEQGYGGENSADAAAREKSLIDSGAANRGRQGAIVGDFARRGQLGSGLELSARMDASQAEGDRLASQGLELEGQRRMRALAAMQGAGNLAGNIASDDYKIAADKAKAADAINMFNTTNLIGLGQRNINRTNEATASNLGVKQDISNRNVGVSNFEQEKNKALSQQDYENRMARAAGLTGQYNKMGETAKEQGKSSQDMWGGISSGVGNTLESYFAGANKPKPKASSVVTEEYGGSFDDEDKDYYGSLS